jgi:hypothetical protein
MIWVIRPTLVVAAVVAMCDLFKVYYEYREKS